MARDAFGTCERHLQSQQDSRLYYMHDQLFLATGAPVRDIDVPRDSGLQSGVPCLVEAGPARPVVSPASA